MCNVGYGVLKYTLFFINFIVFLAAAALTGFMIWGLTISEDLPVESFFEFIFCTECVGCLIANIFLDMTFFGWLGALRDNTLCLLVYRGVLLFVILFQVAFLVFIILLVCVPETRSTSYLDQLSKEAIEKYRDREGLKEFIDGIQERWQCCGVSNSKEGYKDWSDNMYFNCSVPNIKFHDFCSVPFSCCKFTKGEYKNLLCGKGIASLDVDETTRESTIYTHGCVYALVEKLKGGSLVIGGVAVGILFPQLMLYNFAKTLSVTIAIRREKLGQGRSFDRIGFI